MTKPHKHLIIHLDDIERLRAEGYEIKMEFPESGLAIVALKDGKKSRVASVFEPQYHIGQTVRRRRDGVLGQICGVYYDTDRHITALSIEWTEYNVPVTDVEPANEN